MLSYQHIYHAGNRADVLKHVILAEVIRHLKLRDRPLFYVETHSGRGVYDLSSKEAQKTGEFQTGIAPLYARSSPAKRFKPYINVIRTENNHPLEQPGTLKVYPGSPKIAHSLLAPNDRLCLFERHPQEFIALEKNLNRYNNIDMRKGDGFQASLPLKPRSGEDMLIFIDPSYETDEDIERLVWYIPEALSRWPKAKILIWMPLYEDGREEDLGGFLSEQSKGFVVGARWLPEKEETALIGSAMIGLRLQDLTESAFSLAQSLERDWAKADSKKT